MCVVVELLSVGEPVIGLKNVQSAGFLELIPELLERDRELKLLANAKSTLASSTALMSVAPDTMHSISGFRNGAIPGQLSRAIFAGSGCF
jgi:hypothetical protein